MNSPTLPATSHTHLNAIVRDIEQHEAKVSACVQTAWNVRKYTSNSRAFWRSRAREILAVARKSRVSAVKGTQTLLYYAMHPELVA